MPSLHSLTFVVRDGARTRLSREAHEVSFIRRASGRVISRCSCSRREGGGHCVHARRLLAGDTRGLVGGEESDLEVLDWWVSCFLLRPNRDERRGAA